MPAVISLRDVVEALDLQSDELTSYLDPDSGEIITFNEEEAVIAERGDWAHAPDWMREYLPKVNRVLKNERAIPLPDRAHIDEWRMMLDFADERANSDIRAQLIDAIHGDGAFRLFRRTIERLGVEEQWHQFRSQAMERLARQWLEENKLRYR